MATKVVQNQEDVEGTQADGTVSVSGAPSSLVSGGGTPSPMGTTMGAQKAPGSGRFTNLQKYLSANQGAGQRLAGEIEKGATKEGQKLGEQTQAAGSGIQSQLDAEKQRIAQASGFAQNIGQNAESIAADPTKLNQFTQLRTGQTGLDAISKQAAEQFGAAQSQLGTVQGIADQAGSEAGRFGLLQQMIGRPSYNRGQQRLDQLFLQSEGGNVLGNLQRQLAQQAQASGKTLQEAQGTVQSGLTSVGDQAKAAQAQLMSALGGMDDAATTENEAKGAFGDLQKALQARKDQFVTSNTGEQQGIANELSRIGATNSFGGNTALAERLGLKTGQSLYDLDLSQLVNPSFNAGNITEQNIASSDDVNRYQALAKLAGVDPSYINAQQAGTAQGLQLDPSKLQAEITRRGDMFNQYTGTAKNLAGNVNHLMSSNAFYGQLIGNPMYSKQLTALVAADPAKYGIQPPTTPGKGSGTLDPMAGINVKPGAGGATPVALPEGGIDLKSLMYSPAQNQLMRDYFGINEQNINPESIQKSLGLLREMPNQMSSLLDQDYWQDVAAMDQWNQGYQKFNPNRKV